MSGSLILHLQRKIQSRIYTRITLAANTTTTIFTFIHLGLMTANHTMAYHCKITTSGETKKKHNALQPHQAPVVKKNQREGLDAHQAPHETRERISVGKLDKGDARDGSRVVNLWSGSSVFKHIWPTGCIQSNIKQYINIYYIIILSFTSYTYYIYPNKLQSM